MANKRLLILGCLALLSPSNVSAQSSGKITVLANPIDYALVESYLEIFERLGFEVNHVTSEEFNSHMNDSLLFIFGGQNAPEGVGEVVSPMLTSQEKRELKGSWDARRVLVVPNAFTQGQAVFIFAGYSKQQTRLIFGEALGDVIRGLSFKDSDALDQYTSERTPTPKLNPTQPYTEVDAAQANALIDNVQDLTVIDVRSRVFYDAGHIPGAVSVPARKAEDLLSSYPKDGTYLLYCGGNSESIYLGNLMAEKGYPNIYRLVDGYVAWRRAGYPRAR